MGVARHAGRPRCSHDLVTACIHGMMPESAARFITLALAQTCVRAQTRSIRGVLERGRSAGANKRGHRSCSE